MAKNALGTKLAKGEPVLGVFVSIPSPDIVEMCGHLGFDFVVIDAEHGPVNVETSAHLVRAAECAGIVPIVNVPSLGSQTIGRYLDIGMMGIQAPQVHDRGEAEALVRSVKYYPQGMRGMSRPRADGYGLVGSRQDYMEQANRDTMIVATIEAVEGVRRLPQITGVEGIDVFFIGPGDLSQALGVPGQLDTPLVQSAIDSVVAQVRGAGRYVGISAADAATARRYIAKGAQYVVTGMTGLLARSAQAYLQDVRRR